MGRIEELAERYRRHIAAPWPRNLAGAQKTIFLVYPKQDERRLRARRDEFEILTKEAGHTWRSLDLTDAFSAWIAADEYRDAFFECPEDLTMKLESELADHVARKVIDGLTAADVDENTVVGLFGSAALYGFVRVSLLLKRVEADIRGRLVVFFPGDHDQNNYRLLDARDGWNYLAVPITLHQGDE